MHVTHRGLLARAALLVVITMVFFTGASAECCVGDCSDSDKPQSFDKHGVKFEYPGAWRPAKQDSPPESADWSEAIGLDDDNLVVVSAYTLRLAVTRDNFDELLPDLKEELQQLLEGQGVKPQGPERLTVGGMPALTYRGPLSRDGAPPTTNLWTFIFNGKTEYFLNCQATEDRVEEVEGACEQVKNSFTLK